MASDNSVIVCFDTYWSFFKKEHIDYRLIRQVLTPTLIVAIVANSFILFAFYKKPLQIFGERKTFNWLFECFIVNEFAMSLYGLIQIYVQEYIYNVIYPEGTMIMSILICFPIVQAWNLLFISIDRWFAVVRPTETHYWNRKIAKILFISTASCCVFIELGIHIMEIVLTDCDSLKLLHDIHKNILAFSTVTIIMIIIVAYIFLFGYYSCCRRGCRSRVGQAQATNNNDRSQVDKNYLGTLYFLVFIYNLFNPFLMIVFNDKLRRFIKNLIIKCRIEI